MLKRMVLICTWCLIVCGTAFAGNEVRHPLDALTEKEYWTIYRVIRDAGHYDEKTHFASVLLHEPPKQEVLAWKPGDPIPRKANVILFKEGHSYEAGVDINDAKILSFREMTDTYAPILGSEYEEMSRWLTADPQVAAALKKRGVNDLTKVRCDLTLAGYVGLPEQDGRRIGWGGCYYVEGVARPWGREIGGIFILADMTAKKVLRLTDYGVAPIPNNSTDYDFDGGEALTGTTPIYVTQPLGPSFRIKDGEVSWQQWHFRFRLDQRVGPVVHLVSLEDHGKRRSVMYEGSVSELFVPYMDLDETWLSHVFLDSGEFYQGGFIKPLLKGVDCPDNARYFSAVLFREEGGPSTQPQTACLFERPGDGPAWRHGEEGVAGRPSRELVLRTAAVIGNYDYLFDWRFEQDGSIHVAVGATGIIESKAVSDKTAAEMTSSMQHTDHELHAQYGHLVDVNTDGVNHDHFFSFRLDLDVDGTKNSFMADRLVQEKLPAGASRKAIWVAKPSIAHTESDAMMDLRGDQPAMWHIINPNTKGPLGYPTGFEIMPGVTGPTLLPPDDPQQKRGAFALHQLWITPYSPDEFYAGGLHVTMSKGQDGLAVWTKANRDIENTDIVAWYTMGFHHVPRAEDWPVMPVMWHDFIIRPYDFFPRNPTMDLPIQP